MADIKVRKIRFVPRVQFSGDDAKFEKISEENGIGQISTLTNHIVIDLEDINWIRFGRDVERYENG